MSASMYWRPVPVKPDGEPVDDDLMYLLRRRLWDDETSQEPRSGCELEIGHELIPYLEGLADGNVDGAAELIEAIRRHKSIQIWIER